MNTWECINTCIFFYNYCDGVAMIYGEIKRDINQ